VSRKTDSLVILALAIAFLGGVAWFPRSLEPGRSEVDGTRLNLLIDQGASGVANDWFAASPHVKLSRTAETLTIQGTEDGLQIMSRGLAVYGDECYALEIRGRAAAGTSRLAITDEDQRQLLQQWTLGATSRDAEWRLVFQTGSYRRIAVVLFGEFESDFRLQAARLVRLHQTTACG